MGGVTERCLKRPLGPGFDRKGLSHAGHTWAQPSTWDPLGKMLRSSGRVHSEDSVGSERRRVEMGQSGSPGANATRSPAGGPHRLA